MYNNSPIPQSHYFCGQKGIYYGKKKTSECPYLPLPRPYDHPQNTTAPVHPEGHQDRACTAAPTGSIHLGALLRCKPSAAPAAAFFFHSSRDSTGGKLPRKSRDFVTTDSWNIYSRAAPFCGELLKRVPV